MKGKIARNYRSFDHKFVFNNDTEFHTLIMHYTNRHDFSYATPRKIESPRLFALYTWKFVARCTSSSCTYASLHSLLYTPRIYLHDFQEERATRQQSVRRGGTYVYTHANSRADRGSAKIAADARRRRGHVAPRCQ